MLGSYNNAVSSLARESIVPASKYALKNPTDRQRFKAALQMLSTTQWIEKIEQYCDYRLDGKSGAGWLRAKQFSNGTLYLEASDETLLAMMTALLNQAPVSAKTSRVQHSLSSPSSTGEKPLASAKPNGLINITGAYIGTDESGKGDYFGPLVIAGAYVTEETAAQLKALGVMDSKKLTDAKIGGMVAKIIEIIGDNAVEAIVMSPAKYNELYLRFKNNGKNLNHLLAWGHATIIENLLTRHPDCGQAIADQFGNERYILSQLKEKGKGIKLYQTPRAEANIGVATASILARYKFTQKMQQLSTQFGVQLPFGANNIVKTKAREFISRHGKDNLNQIAKLHFKTTNEL